MYVWRENAISIERRWSSFENPIPKESQQPIGEKVDVIISQWELKVKRSNLHETRENASGQITIGFSFESDWLGRWRDFLPNHEVNLRNTNANEPFSIQ